MTAELAPSRAAWTSPEMRQDKSWIYPLDASAQVDLLQAIRRLPTLDQPLLAYRREDFDLGCARRTLDAAFAEARTGRGLSLVKGLPRDGVTEREFELLTWGIGLHYGVGRPQGKASQYLSAVRDAGVDYRSTTGRGYSSSAKLDYHTDSADVVGLSCYNKATAGGESMVISALTAYARMQELHPDMVHYLHQPVHFSRQGEFREGEAPSYPHPVFDEADGQLCVRWNRNRVASAQKIDGVPKISERHWDALEKFDALLRDPDIEFTMMLEPGDLQLVNSHVTLHARTDYVDDPAMKRLLFRLWLAPPGSLALPPAWLSGYKSTRPNEVRGGILGLAYDETCRAFDRRQAAAMGMVFDDGAHR